MPTDRADFSLRFRPAGMGDIALIASMHARSWTASYRGILPDEYLDHDVHAERLAHWQARMPELEAADLALIAEHDGEPIGFVCMVEPDAQSSVLVDNLHTLPGHQGLGTGSAMLAEAARSRQARELYLYVLEADAAAISFYESRGWKRAARESDNMAGVDLFSLRYVLPFG